LVRAIIVLLAAPILLVTLFGKGFEVGNVLTNSAKAALGNAYDFQVRNQGNELEVSGDITYGLWMPLSNAVS
jgi:uncharacterized protein (DUF2062 family)